MFSWKVKVFLGFAPRQNVMLDLASSRWTELTHAYGEASDIPVLLDHLKTASAPEDCQSEPWASLWSALCHEHQVFTASYAAVPHIVDIAAAKPGEERLADLHLVSVIEALRHRDEAPPVPPDLKAYYHFSIRRAASLMLECFLREWNKEAYTVTLGGLAALLGHPGLGMAILEFTGENECPRCGNIFPLKGYELFSASQWEEAGEGGGKVKKQQSFDASV